MRKLFVPFDSYKGQVGGPATFMPLLKDYLDKTGFPYARQPHYLRPYMPRAGGITRLT